METAHSAPGPSVKTTMSVLILEDQEVIRRGLLDIMLSIPDVDASAAPMDSVCDTEMLRAFDVTLISTLTLMNAERAGFRLDSPNRVIVIVPSSQPEQLEIAARRRANGYIMQDDLTSATLRRAISGVVDGQLIIPDAIAAYLLNRARDQHPVPPSGYLRPREAEVLELLVAGYSNKEIARKLRISVHGVKRHVSTLLTQFHSPNRVHLVSHILRSGLLPVSDAGADRARRQGDAGSGQHPAIPRGAG